MKRKVNRVGQNTLTVSLPNKWVKRVGVEAGDEIEVVEEGSNLAILIEEKGKKLKKAKLDLKGFNKMMLNRFLHEFYRQGVEEIVLTYDQETYPNFKKDTEVEINRHINKVIERFIGMEVVSQTKNKIVIQSLMPYEEWKKLEVIEQRMFFLIKDFFEAFLEALDGDFRKFYLSSYDYHDNITKFTAYYSRLLNFSDLSKGMKSRLFSLVVTIDKMIDKMRHASERVNEMGRSTPRLKKYLKMLFDDFLRQFSLVTKKNGTHEDMARVIRDRYAVVNALNSAKFTAEEFKVISEVKIMPDCINDFTECFVARNIEKYVEKY